MHYSALILIHVTNWIRYLQRHPVATSWWSTSTLVFSSAFACLSVLSRCSVAVVCCNASCFAKAYRPTEERRQEVKASCRIAKLMNEWATIVTWYISRYNLFQCFSYTKQNNRAIFSHPVCISLQQTNSRLALILILQTHITVLLNLTHATS